MELNLFLLSLSQSKHFFMKIPNSLFFLITGFFFNGQVVLAQNRSGVDSTGLPGDNFSLQGALQMFQKAGSIEEFEKLINSENNNINNLDLNEDGYTDYIRVIDNSEQDLHAFVLQVPVSDKENQDIAVIELEKTGEASAMIQIIGDEDIYGEEVIVEPDGGDEADEGGKGPYYTSGTFTPGRIVVNVWTWPAVRFVYRPGYRRWVSPWRWHYYPVWWKPWRPVSWRVWHPRVVVFHHPFVIAPAHRVVRAHAVYRPVRVTSVSVRTKNATAVNHYRVTRKKAVVTGPRGNKAVKKTMVRKNGRVKARRSTVRKKRG